MLAPSPVAIVPAQSIDAIDVLPLLVRVRRALEDCLSVPRLPVVEEQQISWTYVGLVELHQRLGAVARACHDTDDDDLRFARADLLARVSVAVSLLESLTALHRLPAGRADTPSITTAIRERIARLEGAYGRALFA